MYDYVIVGAGSAGCVLACRLTEDPAPRVLLLEAGPPDSADEIHIPAAINLLFQTQYDWDFQTEPAGTGRRPVRLLAARAARSAASSSINAMIYIRGNRLDYDTWRDDYGCAGWGYTRHAALFPPGREQLPRARPPTTARPARSVCRTSRHKSTLTKAFVGRHPGVRAAAANDDFNGRGPGRHRLLPGHPARRPALVGGRRLPAPGPVPAQPHHGDRRAGYRDRGRGRPRHRRALPAPRRGGTGPGRGRGHPRRPGPSAARSCCMLSGVGPADHLRRARHLGGRRQPGRWARTCPITRSSRAMWHTPRDARACGSRPARCSSLRWR